MYTKGVRLTKTGIKDAEEIKKILESEGFSTYIWSDPPGTYYPVHTHPDREVRWIIKGSITIGIGDEEIKLEEGDRLDLEAGIPHWARTEKGVRYVAGSK